MAASSWPSPTSLGLLSAVFLQCQLLVSDQRSFPPGGGREGVVSKAVQRGDQKSWEEVAWEKEEPQQCG